MYLGSFIALFVWKLEEVALESNFSRMLYLLFFTKHSSLENKRQFYIISKHVFVQAKNDSQKIEVVKYCFFILPFLSIDFMSNILYNNKKHKVVEFITQWGKIYLIYIIIFAYIRKTMFGLKRWKESFFFYSLLSITFTHVMSSLLNFMTIDNAWCRIHYILNINLTEKRFDHIFRLFLCLIRKTSSFLSTLSPIFIYWNMDRNVEVRCCKSCVLYFSSYILSSSFCFSFLLSFSRKQIHPTQIFCFMFWLCKMGVFLKKWRKLIPFLHNQNVVSSLVKFN